MHNFVDNPVDMRESLYKMVIYAPNKEFIDETFAELGHFQITSMDLVPPVALMINQNFWGEHVDNSNQAIEYFYRLSQNHYSEANRYSWERRFRLMY